ncbi:MAG TPA: M20/M25/M40 family metallo-hydrolase [Terriglobales bacterium]|nr:M20/M25/M40 family metallo-hydrolase [Terriglobales bacterium]
MNFRLAAAICALVMASSLASVAQRGHTSKRPEVDPRITAALKEVSAARVRATVEKLVSFGNRSTLSANDAALAAAGKGVVAVRDWIRSELERYSKECGGCLEVQFDTFTQEPADRVPTPTEISNVYAVLRGTTDPDRIYIVSGHYDSRNSDPLDIHHPAPGANDDASGTAVSLECTRVLSKLKFPATIIFLAVSGEEQGLYGSRHFAQMAKEKGWKIDAVLNNDIVGGDRNSGQDHNIVRVFSEGIPAAATEREVRLLRALGGENDSPSRQLARYIRETAAKYLPGPFGPKLVFRRDRYLRGGDHTSFNEAGFAAVRFTEYREDYRHQHQNSRTENGIEYGDLPKFVDFEYLANVARLNAAVLAALASAPASPGKVRLLTKDLENDSTLEWEAAPGATSYEVLWRPTTAAEWENVVPVGNVTRATLPRSKDNVVFAVRSAAARGHRSLPVVPQPER